MARFYTGVGSRETPHEDMQLMRHLAAKLAFRGWTLRSGGADGADTAFQDGWWDACLLQDACGPLPKAEIYVPWDGFNGHDMSNYNGCNYILSRMPSALQQQAEQTASSIHPAWGRLSRGARGLHTRNVFQVLGQTLDNPSKFLVCWAPTDKNGVPKGGTRTAWVLAQREGVECFNLYNDADRQRIEQWLEA